MPTDQAPASAAELKPFEGPLPEERSLVKRDRPPVPARTPRLEQVVGLLGGTRTVGASIAATLVTGVWLGLFTVGISVPSEPYRTRMLAMASPDGVPAGAPSIAESLTAIAFAYTPTNLALLCCAAALAGCLGRMATTRNGEDTEHQDGDGASATGEHGAGETGQAAAALPDASLLAPAMSAVTWGFFVYLVLISGTIVLTGDPFKETTPEQYFRLPGSASLFSFAVGWQPQILNQLVSAVGKTGLFKGK